MKRLLLLDEGNPTGQFFLAGITGQGYPVCLTNAFLQRNLGRVFTHPGCELLGQVDEYRRIDQGQGLRRHGAFLTVAYALQGVGSVEKLKQGRQVAALDRQVDAAARLAFIERSRAERGGVERAADGEQGIPKGLRLQSP